MQQFKSHIDWTCPNCGHANHQHVVVPELNFAAEKSSDMSVQDQADIECDVCHSHFTGEVWVHPDHTSFDFNDPVQFSFTGDMPFYDPPEEDEFYEPADDPYSVAMEALKQLHTMVGSASPANDAQFTNRLIFAGAVSCMEAYLGDTLINAVQAETDVRTRLVSSNRAMGEITATAAEITADPDVVTKRIQRELRKVLYHSLEKVTALYRDAFRINLMPSKVERDVLFPAMVLRHHCVHRNGRDENGTRLTVFTDGYVRSVIATIGKVVTHIEDKRRPF